MVGQVEGYRDFAEGRGEVIDELRELATLNRGLGMDGSAVLLAIVDTGINLAHLRSRGLSPRFSAERSWAPPQPPTQPQPTPGEMPVSHGTMCAFDALIAAPQATLLDIAVLSSRRTGA